MIVNLYKNYFLNYINCKINEYRKSISLKIHHKKKLEYSFIKYSSILPGSFIILGFLIKNGSIFVFCGQTDSDGSKNSNPFIHFSTQTSPSYHSTFFYSLKHKYFKYRHFDLSARNKNLWKVLSDLRSRKCENTHIRFLLTRLVRKSDKLLLRSGNLIKTPEDVAFAWNTFIFMISPSGEKLVHVIVSILRMGRMIWKMKIWKNWMENRIWMVNHLFIY